MAKSVKDMVRQYERNRYAFSEFLGLAEPDGVQNVNRLRRRKRDGKKVFDGLLRGR